MLRLEHALGVGHRQPDAVPDTNRVAPAPSQRDAYAYADGVPDNCNTGGRARAGR